MWSTPTLDRMISSPGYADLMGEIRMHAWDNPRDTASDWYFATAGIVWMETGEQINGYCPSILYRQGEWDHDWKPDGYSVDRIRDMLYPSGDVSLEDVKLVNTVITRYLGWCNLAGLDY